MAFNVIITEPANDDLDEITTYISEELQSPSAADRLTKRIGKIIDNLSSMPEMYDTLDQNPSLRKVPIGKYLMIFRLDPSSGTVQILRFFHGTQDYEAIL